jgi:SsrA-binding protein
MNKEQKPPRLIAQNKKARHNFEILDTCEAGLVLQGSEVKSLRQGHVSFKDGYVRFSDGEAWLVGVHIAPYENAGPVGQGGHDPERPRKLLLHNHEIKTLMNKVEQKGLTLVPLKLYFSRGKVKLLIGLARGKKTFDRREDLKRRASERDMARDLLGKR